VCGSVHSRVGSGCVMSNKFRVRGSDWVGSKSSGSPWVEIFGGLGPDPQWVEIFGGSGPDPMCLLVLLQK